MDLGYETVPPNTTNLAYTWSSSCKVSIYGKSHENYSLSSALSTYLGHTFLDTTTTTIWLLEEILQLL